jgi:hypothetical protein
VKKTLAVLILTTVTLVNAQTPVKTAMPVQNLIAVGNSYNINATPSVAGSILFAHYIAAPGTYAFTAIDVLPGTIKPFTVTSNIGIGLAQKLFTIGRTSLYMPTAAGVSWTGGNTGWQWSGGVAVTVQLQYSFCLVPTVRFLKSSVSGGSGYQPVVGLSLGFGK